MKLKLILFLAILNSISFAQTDLPNDGITSPSHKKYMNKIVFTSSLAPLKFGAEVESGFVNKFELGQPIFFRVYLDNSLFNYSNKLMPNQKREEINNKGGFIVKYYLDNVEYYSGNACDGTSEFKPKEQEELTSFKGALRNPDERGIGENGYDRFLYKALDKLTAGEHNLKIEFYPTVSGTKMIVGAVVATGEFTLQVTEAYANFFKGSYKNFSKMKFSKDFNDNKIAVDNSGKTIATYTKGPSNNQTTVKDNNGNIIHTESVDFNGNIELKTVNGSWLGTFKKDFNGNLTFESGN